MANMSWRQIVDSVMANAFNESNRAECERWAQDYYRRTWNLIDWPFKTPDLAELAVVGGNASPTMPEGVESVIEIMDENRSPLAEITQEQYDGSGYSDPGVSGKPGVYWMMGSQPLLGPIPDSDYTFYLRYEQGVSHRDLNLDVVAGPPEEDSDYLYWDGYEYLIVFGARATGKLLTNNPTGDADQNQADAMLLDMMSRWFPGGNAPAVYGRDRIGER